MVIKVMPEDLAWKSTIAPTERMAVISITNKLDEVVAFPENPNVIEIYRMKFDDEVSSEKNGPVQSDFDGLKEFADSIIGKADTLIVHCAAGMSRSPAVAEALVKYFRDEEVEYVEPDYPHKRNPLVYSLACRELGIEESQGRQRGNNVESVKG